MLWPREHGSWGILLFPLLSAVYLVETYSLLTAAALAAAMATFLAREPLIVLARDRWVWSAPRPEVPQARRTLLYVLPVLVASGAALWFGGAVRGWLLGLGAVAAVLMAVSAYAALHRLQRSTTLQIVGSFGLTLSAALAWIAAGREPDPTLWLLIGSHTVHAVGGVLTVHARLEALQNRAKPDPVRSARAAAYAWLLIQAAAVVAFWVGGRPLLAGALALPAGVHCVGLYRLPNTLHTPLKQVGVRELILSGVFSALVVAALR